jgi:hypothetical protein
MPQVEAVDLEPVGPLAEIGLASVAGRRVARKPRSDDQTRACAEKLDPCLVADFHAATGEQSDAATQVRELRTLPEILLGAGDAQAVVEMVDRREFLLADVTNTRVFSFGIGLVVGVELVRFRRREIRRCDEDWLAAQLADAGCGEESLFALHLLQFLFSFDNLQELAAAERVGA